MFQIIKKKTKNIKYKKKYKFFAIIYAIFSKIVSKISIKNKLYNKIFETCFLLKKFRIIRDQIDSLNVIFFQQSINDIMNANDFNFCNEFFVNNFEFSTNNTRSVFFIAYDKFTKTIDNRFDDVVVVVIDDEKNVFDEIFEYVKLILN